MTSEQKKAIDACKDQVAEKEGWGTWKNLREKTLGGTVYDAYYHRAMHLYGEQCRKEAAKPFLCNKCGGFYDRYNGLCHSCSNENIADKA